MAKKKKLVLKDTAAAPDPDDYQGRDDMRTLMRAEQIKADPKRHAKAKAHAQAHLQAAAAVSAQAAQPNPELANSPALPNY